MRRNQTVSAEMPKELAPPPLQSGTDERFTGVGVMGVPFASGHYLALRRFPTTSIGPGYTGVWHRDPQSVWTIYVDAPAELSCPRYISSATYNDAQVGPIETLWSAPGTVDVSIPNVLRWHVDFSHTVSTRFMSTAARMLPERAWSIGMVLSAMGRCAGPVLRAGRIRLRGRVPNGQKFQFAPRTVWAVTASTARLNDEDLGTPGRLPAQDRLGDFWLPQRGIFGVATARFENYDSTRHHSAHPRHPQANPVII